MRLYGILDLGYVRESDAARVAAEMLSGGIQILQLRAKDRPAESLLPLAIQLASLCKAVHVPFVINDHASLVAASGADGVHVGQDDLSVAAAREVAGPKAIVGKSTHSLEQAIAASAEGPDYIGYGPLFATPTKPDYSPVGLSAIKAVHEAVNIPIFCIGGIKRSNLASVTAAGAKRIVAVSDILQAGDVAASCREFREILKLRPLDRQAPPQPD